jgi:signal transduction histidine kinase
MTLRRVNGALTFIALIVVGVSTLTLPYGPTGNLVWIIVALAIGTITLVGRAVVDLTDWAPPRLAKLIWAALPVAVTAMAVTSAWATLTNNGGPFSLLSVLAISTGASLFSLRTAGVITAIAVVALDAVGLAYQVSIWDLLGIPVLMLLGLLFGRLISGYRGDAEQASALLANAEALREAESRSAALDERNRIAREIHDVLAHSLGALGVQLQAAQAVLTDQRDIEKALELLGHARRVANDGLVETRRALHALRADTPPLDEALAELSIDHRRQYGARVQFEVSGPPRPLSTDASLALTRTAQEALVNTAKHAPHQPVQVRLDFGSGCTTLTVANRLGANGAVDPARLETLNGGYGLAGLRERLLLIEGSLHAGRREDQWVVTAQIPQ